MRSEVDPRPVVILLVEDSPTDVLIITEALAQIMLQHTLKVVEDGVEALAYLRQSSTYTAEPRPNLIILDLNLPRKNGLEVLSEIKEDTSLRLIPVAVLTTSQADEDILKAYELHANCYVAKPMSYSSFVQVVQSIHEFWLRVAALPPEG